jgi:lipoprotein-anchoring transpeptidase ErfK/SrfK
LETLKVAVRARRGQPLSAGSGQSPPHNLRETATLLSQEDGESCSEPGRKVAMVRRNPGRTRLAFVSMLACIAAHSQPASAQIFWDWGGGQESDGSGRQIVGFSPRFTAGQIIVSFGDRRLYLITRPGEAVSYPIAIPREQDRWQGVTQVTDKKVNPPWRPTPTMLAENPRLPSWVPGGHPMNPLGVRALYLGSSSYRIHGTDAPWTIGTEASKGCIRMYNRDVLDLYPRVPIGTKVTVTWERFEDGGYALSAREPAAGAGERRGSRLREMQSRDLPPEEIDRWAY